MSGMRGYRLEATDFIPHPRIRIERQTANGNCFHKAARGGQKLFHQSRILGKEEYVAHQAAYCFGGSHLVHPIDGTFLQEKERCQGSRSVVTGLGQFSREWRSV